MRATNEVRDWKETVRSGWHPHPFLYPKGGESENIWVVRCIILLSKTTVKMLLQGLQVTNRNSTLSFTKLYELY